MFFFKAADGLRYRLVTGIQACAVPVSAGIAEIVHQRMREEGNRLLHREGERKAAWTLLDYVDVVIHIFTAEAREFYALERLWGEAPVTVLEDDEGQVDPTWEDTAEEPRPLTARDFV